MRQKLRRRAVCLFLAFCCLFSLTAFPASADSGSASAKNSEEKKEKYASLSVDLAGEFIITNDRGEVLSFIEGELGGDMEIYYTSTVPFGPGAPVDLHVNVPVSDSFTFEKRMDREISFSVADDRGYARVSGSKWEKAVLSTTGSIELEGDELEYHVAYRPANENGESLYDGSLNIDGTGTGHAVITRVGDVLTVAGDSGEYTLSQRKGYGSGYLVLVEKTPVIPLHSEDTAVINAWDFTDFSKIYQMGLGNYYAFVTEAVKKELIKGYPDNTFRPETRLTRGDAVVMLYRLHEKRKEKASPSTGAYEFPDVPRYSYQREALLWAVKEGLIKGYPDGTLRPQKKITVGELTMLFYRYLQMLGEEDRYEEAAYYWDEKACVPQWGREAARGMSGWKIFPKSEAFFSDSVSRLQACVCFIRLQERLTLPAVNEESTPRLKYRVTRHSVWEEMKRETEMPELIFSYEVYENYRSSLQAGFPDWWGPVEENGLEVEEIKQPVEPEITEEFFENNSLLVMELWAQGDDLLDRELAELSFEGDTVRTTFLDEHGSGHTANMTGVILLIEVPKDVNRVNYKALSWTTEGDLTPY